jgi:hypothetical protein
VVQTVNAKLNWDSRPEFGSAVGASGLKPAYLQATDNAHKVQPVVHFR